MDWGNIKYIFQVPLSWYRKIHDRVFNAYGTNFIVVKEGDWYGGTEIGIDEDVFADAVNQVTDLSGLAKSVDNVTPDANGNIQLDAARLSAD